MSSSGRHQESELANTLEDDYGYAAFRCGASGSATTRARPDVIALRDGASYAVEVKKASEGQVTLNGHEITDLIDFAERAGGMAVLAIRPSFNRFDSWLIYDAADLTPTDAGNYYVGTGDHDRAQSIEEFFGGGGQ